MATPKATLGYVHGFTKEEQNRLYRQARFTEHRVHAQLPFRRARKLLEVGCGVGAQTEILLRRFPELTICGIDASKSNIEQAKRYLDQQPCAGSRFELHHGDAGRLTVIPGAFDAAFVCWLLEHVSDPGLVLSEIRRVLSPGANIVVTEVQNATFFLSPYSPNTMTYWSAFNDHQVALGGDPFIGAKLGNLLQRIGYRDIRTDVRTIFLDNREPLERAEFIGFWTELLLSAAEGLLDAKRVSNELVEGMKLELDSVARDPDAVFFYSFIQAYARVG